MGIVGQCALNHGPEIQPGPRNSEIRRQRDAGNPHFDVRHGAITEVLQTQGVNEETAREAMRLAAHKLPVKTKFLTREEA